MDSGVWCRARGLGAPGGCRGAGLGEASRVIEQGVQRGVGDRVGDGCAAATSFHEATIPQHAQVLRGVRGLDAEALLHLADGHTTGGAQQLEHAHPHRAGERLEQLCLEVMRCGHVPDHIEDCAYA